MKHSHRDADEAEWRSEGEERIMTAVTAPETHKLEMSTGAIHFSAAGEGDPVVVLHQDIGSPGWLSFYDLLAADHRVYVPDLPGFGSSDALDWARHPRDLAATMQQFLDRLGLTSVDLVGLGFGGWVAAEMAVCNEARIRHLILVGAAGLPPADGHVLDQFVSSAEEYVRAGFSSSSMFDALFPEPTSPEQVLVWEVSREVIARVSWKPYMTSYQLPALIGNLSLRTLVLWGEHDQVVPLSVGEQYAARIPGAQLRVIPNSGHFVEIEQPEAVVTCIREHLPATATG